MAINNRAASRQFWTTEYRTDLGKSRAGGGKPPVAEFQDREVQVPHFHGAKFNRIDFGYGKSAFASPAQTTDLSRCGQQLEAKTFCQTGV